MRIRTIKPEFFTHEGLFDLEKESRLPVRIAFAGLWCAADKCGRFKWEPRRLGVAILPYDSCDFSRVLDALTTRGFIVKYQVGDAWFGCIPSFERHQVINNRERDSDIPEPSPTDDRDACPTRAPRVTDACPTPLCNAQAEGKGRERNTEGKGKERSAALPQDSESSAAPAALPSAEVPAVKVSTPTLEEVIAYGTGPTGSATPDCCEAWWNDHEARPRHVTGGYTDKSGLLVADWRASLRGFAVRWRDVDARRNQPRAARPAPAQTPMKFEDEPPR